MLPSSRRGLLRRRNSNDVRQQRHVPYDCEWHQQRAFHRIMDDGKGYGEPNEPKCPWLTGPERFGLSQDLRQHDDDESKSDCTQRRKEIQIAVVGLISQSNVIQAGIEVWRTGADTPE